MIKGGSKTILTQHGRGNIGLDSEMHLPTDTVQKLYRYCTAIFKLQQPCFRLLRSSLTSVAFSTVGYPTSHNSMSFILGRCSLRLFPLTLVLLLPWGQGAGDGGGGGVASWLVTLLSLRMWEQCASQYEANSRENDVSLL